jgi:D-glycero-alpha-D-manno-heptose-7-phosphate kinase
MSAMTVGKTPLRIPLAGGLTDIKEYAELYGGITVSMTIDKYVYVALKHNLDGYFELQYQNVREKVNNARQIRNDLIREALYLTGLQDTPLSLSVMVDLAGESGLGTSGAVTVSLLHAMYKLKGESPSKDEIYQQATRIEVDILQGASGYHDPTICALGGLKVIEYEGSKIVPRDVALSDDMRTQFADSLLFFYSGRHAKSKPSLDLLSSHIREAFDLLHDIKAIGIELEQAFLTSNLQRVAEIIAEQQTLKQQLPGRFLDDYVEDITQRVRDVGAYAQLPGGKISAFVIVCCPDGQHAAVREALSDLREVPFGLEAVGTTAVTV